MLQGFFVLSLSTSINNNNKTLSTPSKWLTCNFSLSDPYNIQQKGNENIQTYQADVVILI